MKDPEEDLIFSKWLNGTLEPSERAAFEASPEGEDFLSIFKASKQLKMPTYDVQVAWHVLNADLSRSKVIALKPAKPTRPKTRPWLYAAAAVACLLAGTYYFLYAESTVKSPYGAQRRVELPDGSDVTLQANSSIRYRKWNFTAKRKIQLEGEAFFKVVNGSKSPNAGPISPGSTFLVDTEGGSILVLGTSFNVKARQDLEVECYTGTVAMRVDGDSLVLEAGMGATVLSTGKLYEYEHDKDTPAWLAGKSVFSDAPLRTVLSELENLYGIHATLPESLKELKYSGAFPHNNAEAAVKLVLDPLDVNYDYNADQRHITIIK